MNTVISTARKMYTPRVSTRRGARGLGGVQRRKALRRRKALAAVCQLSQPVCCHRASCLHRGSILMAASSSREPATVDGKGGMLLATSGPYTPRIFVVAPRGGLLGRSRKCAISLLHDCEVSHNHAVIEPSQGGVVVRHLAVVQQGDCLLYTSPSPRDQRGSRMPSSA